MKPERIDKFIDRLCGLFPKDNVARNTVKNAWHSDKVLLEASYEDSAKALQILEKDKYFPTLNRVKEVIRGLAPAKQHSMYCHKCEGSGWDTGMRMKRDLRADEETWIIERHSYETELMGHIYSAAIQCSCIKQEIENDEETMAMSYL